jgi:hypothetical protein
MITIYIETLYMKDIDIFLIHGTFAKKAEWVKDQSIFCKKLKERIDGNVCFHQYEWDGKNSFKSRYNEGVKLGKKVDSLKDKESIKILIGHSHGGNIGLYSLRASKKIDLVVTLGTPFIINKTKLTIKAIDHFAKFFTVILLGFITGYFVSFGIEGDKDDMVTFSALIFLSLVCVLFYIYKKGKVKIVDIVKGFKKEIDYIRRMDVNIVNVQYDFDEANFFLNLINERIRPISNLIYYILNKLNNPLFVFIYFAIFSLSINEYFVDYLLFDIFILLIAFLTIPALFIIVFFPISLLINGLLFNRIALGSYPWFLTFFLRIKVSKHLNDIIGSAKDYLLKPFQKSRVELNHSMYYIDPNVADIIVKEVNELIIKE